MAAGRGQEARQGPSQEAGGALQAAPEEQIQPGKLLVGLSFQPPASPSVMSVMSVTSDNGEDGGQRKREDSDTLSVSDMCQLDGAAASVWTTTSDESDEDMDQNDDEEEHSEDEGNIAESEADIDESEDEEDESDTHTDDTESENEAEPSDNEGDEGDDESDCNDADAIPCMV